MSGNSSPTEESRAGNKVYFDEYSANYDELLHESTKFYAADSEYFAKYKVDLIRQASTRPVARVLEYGCGTGRNVEYLRAAFPNAEVVGTDVSAASLEVAAASNPAATFAVERDGLDIGKFDLIFVASVFHHIPPAERPAVTRMLAQRLAPQGSIDVFEHNPYNPVTRWIVNTCPFDADAILLKPEELRSLFKGAGIDLQRLSYCLFVPPRLSWLAPLEKYLGWLPLGGQYWVRGSAP